MGRQFQMYLLPRDAVELVAGLRRRLGFRMIAQRSPTHDVVEMESPLISQANSTRIDCLLVVNREANISNCYGEAQDYWSIDSSWSEVIEFSGCHFDGKTLKRGRMWFETGRFDTAGVWREKSDEFLKWADAIYRTTKKILLRDPDLDAYVGGSVPSWRASGGQLVEFAAKGVPSIIAGSRKMQ